MEYSFEVVLMCLDEVIVHADVAFRSDAIKLACHLCCANDIPFPYYLEKYADFGCWRNRIYSVHLNKK